MYVRAHAAHVDLSFICTCTCTFRCTCTDEWADRHIYVLIQATRLKRRISDLHNVLHVHIHLHLHVHLYVDVHVYVYMYIISTCKYTCISICMHVEYIFAVCTISVYLVWVPRYFVLINFHVWLSNCSRLCPSPRNLHVHVRLHVQINERSTCTTCTCTYTRYINICMYMYIYISNTYSPTSPQLSPSCTRPSPYIKLREALQNRPRTLKVWRHHHGVIMVCQQCVTCNINGLLSFNAEFMSGSKVWRRWALSRAVPQAHRLRFECPVFYEWRTRVDQHFIRLKIWRLLDRRAKIALRDSFQFYFSIQTLYITNVSHTVKFNLQNSKTTPAAAALDLCLWQVR